VRVPFKLKLMLLTQLTFKGVTRIVSSLRTNEMLQAAILFSFVGRRDAA